MNKSLTIRRNLPAKRGYTPARAEYSWIIGLLLLALLIYFAMKKQGAIGQYTNTETWDVLYSPDGLPTKITIHRDARRA